MEIVKQVFEGLEVRATERDGEFWFLASDVAKALDISNPRQAVARLDEDEKGVISTDTLGGQQEATFISESGLYSLILGSRKPQAKPFKRWVTHDLLPTLRRTGFYSLREEVVTTQAIARAYGVQARFIPEYMENHKIPVVGTAEDPDTGKVRTLYPRQLVLERFMLGSGMRDGFELRAYSAAWDRVPPAIAI